MGWLETHKPKHQKLADFLLRWSDDAPATYRTLDSALVNFTEFYAAVERTDKATGQRDVWCAVFLVRMFREGRSHHNICYKDMDETMAPYFYNCPARILDLLTPTDNDAANAWRRTCREQIAKRKAKPALLPGTVLYADPPIPFVNGISMSRLVVLERRGSRIQIDGGYRLSMQYLNRQVSNGRIRFTPSAQLAAA
jgi:hypothetical protein